MSRGFTTKRVSQKRNSYFSFANERREQTRLCGFTTTSEVQHESILSCLPSAGGAKACRAFTLIEVVISVALFAVVMFGMAQLYIVYGRIITAQKSSIAVALDGSGIIDATQAAALQADHVVATHIFSGVSYNSGTTTAIFELPAFDSSGTRVQNAYDYIGISASSTNAYRLIDAAPGSARVSGQKLIARVLNALSFTYDTPDFLSVRGVIIEATTSAMVRGQTTQVHLRGHFYLRNI